MIIVCNCFRKVQYRKGCTFIYDYASEIPQITLSKCMKFFIVFLYSIIFMDKNVIGLCINGNIGKDLQFFSGVDSNCSIQDILLDQHDVISHCYGTDLDQLRSEENYSVHLKGWDYPSCQLL